MTSISMGEFMKSAVKHTAKLILSLILKRRQVTHWSRSLREAQPFTESTWGLDDGQILMLMDPLFPSF